MNVLCLMPTFGRPRHLVENAIACWERQTYRDKWLLILDDEWFWLRRAMKRTPSLALTHCRPMPLSKKYNYGVELVQRFAEGATEYGYHGRPNIQYVAVWDDDDLYGPDYLLNHVTALHGSGRGWSHPSRVWSTYTGEPQQEPAAGRFHGSLMVRWNLARWPETTSPLFDQMMLAKLAETGSPADPCDVGPPQYCFRWSDTGAAHVQHFMTAQHGNDWQERYQQAAMAARNVERDRPQEPLIGKLDDNGEKVWRQLWGA